MKTRRAHTREKTECREEKMKNQRVEDRGSHNKRKRKLGVCCCI